MQAKRIMVIGGPGAGKSWLSLRLSALLEIPVYCVDDAVHDARGRVRAKDDIDQTVRAWAAKPQWIIEGGNTRTYADRLSRATVVVWLCPPRWLRLCRVAVRDKLNRSLLYWCWKYDEVFGVKDRRAFEAVGPDTPVFTLMTNKEVAAFLDLMEREQARQRNCQRD